MMGLAQCISFASVSSSFLPVFLDATVKICIISLVAGLAAILLSRSSAVVRHLIWHTAFLAFLLLPILSYTVPKWRALPGWLSIGDFNFPYEVSATRSTQRPGQWSESDSAFQNLQSKSVGPPKMLESGSPKSSTASVREHQLTISRSREQTGLTFTREKKTIRVLFVERPK